MPASAAPVSPATVQPSPFGHPIKTRAEQSTLTRPATEADHDAVNGMHQRCCLDSRFSRYQAARRELRAAEWAHFIRPGRGSSWVTHPVDRPHLAIAVTQVMLTDTDGVGELGLLVEDAWQNLGLGSGLTRYALRQAAALDLTAVTVMTGRDNRRMLAICRRLGAHSPRADGSTIDLTLPVG